MDTTWSTSGITNGGYWYGYQEDVNIYVCRTSSSSYSCETLKNNGYCNLVDNYDNDGAGSMSKSSSYFTEGTNYICIDNYYDTSTYDYSSAFTWSSSCNSYVRGFKSTHYQAPIYIPSLYHHPHHQHLHRPLLRTSSPTTTHHDHHPLLRTTLRTTRTTARPELVV